MAAEGCTVEKPPGADSGKSRKLKATWMLALLPKRQRDRDAAARGEQVLGWEPMWNRDCDRLDKALVGGPSEVLVYGRRYSVDIQRRVCRPLYWKEEPSERRVIRGTWFYKASSNAWHPYEEGDAEKIENMWQDAPERLRTCPEVVLPLSDGVHKVIVRVKPKKIAADKANAADRALAAEREAADPSAAGPEQQREPGEDPSEVYDIYQQRVDAGPIGRLNWRAVKRGYGEYKVDREEEAEAGQELPVDHLVLVVHGIGEALWSLGTMPMMGLRGSMGEMRKLAMQAQLEAAVEAHAVENGAPVEVEGGAAKGDEDKPPAPAPLSLLASALGHNAKGKPRPMGRMEFLPVEWYEAVHDSEADLTKTLRAITLPSIPTLRDVANDVISDILLYMAPAFQQTILTEVANGLNRIYETFCRVNPGFKGKVAIVGHSLGSLVTWDILQAQPEGTLRTAHTAGLTIDVPKLKFEPAALFACGSPIGIFLTTRMESPSVDFRLPTTPRFYNVFHPNDPVAYRVEPLIDRRLQQLPPGLVPCRGGYRMHVQLRKMQEATLASVKSTVNWWSSSIQKVGKALAKQESLPEVQDGPSKETERQLEEAAGIAARLVLNRGDRVDYSLQETNLEATNQYLSALASHSSYFCSEDFVLFILSNLYNDGTLQPEDAAAAPQQNKTLVV